MKNETPFTPEQPKSNFEIRKVRLFAETIYNLPDKSEEKQQVMRFVAKYFAKLESPDNIPEEQTLEAVLKFLKNPYLIVDNSSIANILKQNGYSNQATQQFNQAVKKRLYDAGVTHENNDTTENAGDIIQGKPHTPVKIQTPDSYIEQQNKKYYWPAILIGLFMTGVLGSFFAYTTGIKSPNNSTPTLPESPTQQQK
jgi:hypothetical protein